MARTRVRSTGAAGRGAAVPGFQVGIGIALIALGVVAWNQRRSRARQRRPLRDYSRRSGFPRGVEASRGAASDAAIPADLLTPAPMRPFTAADR